MVLYLDYTTFFIILPLPDQINSGENPVATCIEIITKGLFDLHTLSTKKGPLQPSSAFVKGFTQPLLEFPLIQQKTSSPCLIH